MDAFGGKRNFRNFNSHNSVESGETIRGGVGRKDEKRSININIYERTVPTSFMLRRVCFIQFSRWGTGPHGKALRSAGKHYFMSKPEEGEKIVG